jgi:hypothetical protein
MGAMSDYLEQKFLDEVLNIVAFAGPQNWVALYTAALSDAGGGTEVTGGAYARQRVFENASASTPKWALAVTQGAGSHLGYLVDNIQDIAFPVATANWGLIVAWAIWDAVTAGNLLFWGWLSQTVKLFTADAADVTADTLTSPAHGFINTNRVIVRGGTLPTGLTADTKYFVVGAAADTFQLSLTEGGAAINITAVGQGEAWNVEEKLVNINDQFKFLAGQLDVIAR